MMNWIEIMLHIKCIILINNMLGEKTREFYVNATKCVLNENLYLFPTMLFILQFNSSVYINIDILVFFFWEKMFL